MPYERKNIEASERIVRIPSALSGWQIEHQGKAIYTPNDRFDNESLTAALPLARAQDRVSSRASVLISIAWNSGIVEATGMVVGNRDEMRAKGATY